MNSWNTANKFKGVKMIPPGIHFVYWRCVVLLLFAYAVKNCQLTAHSGLFDAISHIFCSVKSERDSQMSPRTGFFHNFDRCEVLAKRFNPSTEAFDPVSAEDAARIKAGLRDLDAGLGPYPYSSWKKWVGLTSRITPQTLGRLEPSRGLVHSVTQLVPETHKTSKTSDQSSSSCPKRAYLLPENLAKEDCEEHSPSLNEADSVSEHS